MVERQRHQQVAFSSAGRPERPRSFTSLASCCIDSCVMTRPSPRAREARASSSVRRNSARCRSRSSHKASASSTASSSEWSRPLSIARRAKAFWCGARCKSIGFQNTETRAQRQDQNGIVPGRSPDRSTMDLAGRQTFQNRLNQSPTMRPFPRLRGATRRCGLAKMSGPTVPARNRRRISSVNTTPSPRELYVGEFEGGWPARADARCRLNRGSGAARCDSLSGVYTLSRCPRSKRVRARFGPVRSRGGLRPPLGARLPCHRVGVEERHFPAPSGWQQPGWRVACWLVVVFDLNRIAKDLGGLL